jgi:hypothetical protein
VPPVEIAFYRRVTQIIDGSVITAARRQHPLARRCRANDVSEEKVKLGSEDDEMPEASRDNDTSKPRVRTFSWAILRSAWKSRSR